MVSSIIYMLLRRRRTLRLVFRNRFFYVLLFFSSMWILNAILFYYSEHVIAGRSDIDIWASLYWSIITMATIGYGDITPVKGLGWIVAGFAAIMGIVAYTLTVSVIADWFLSKSIRRSLGMAPLKGKEILVIGDSDSCREIIDELILNKYGDKIGWVTPVQPKGVTDIDYLVGDPGSEDVLLKAGIRDAEHIYLCISDDSKTLYTALMIKHLNPKAEIYAVVSSAKAEELLREAGVRFTVSTRLLGRTIASALFEPGVLTILTDIVSAKGKGDLVEETIDKRKAGLSIGEIEDLKNKSDQKHSYRVIAVIRGKDYIVTPPREFKTIENDRIVFVKGVRESL